MKNTVFFIVVVVIQHSTSFCRGLLLGPNDNRNRSGIKIDICQQGLGLNDEQKGQYSTSQSCSFYLLVSQETILPQKLKIRKKVG